MAFDRRSFFGLAGATTLGAALGVPATLAATGQFKEFAGGSSVPFYGAHQAGIATPMQDRLYVAAFNVDAVSRDELKATLKALTSAAERMSRGLGAGVIGAVNGQAESPPDDTGEALDLPAARLTATIGFGPSIFDGRFGFAPLKPSNFNELPKFAADEVPADRLGSDILIQVCADDDQVAFHAIRNLIRISKGTLTPLWLQSGFSGASKAVSNPHTPRNLFGFKDGTANLDLNSSAETAEHLWVDKSWMAGGTYLALRNFRFDIETWDRSALLEQEQVFGRNKGEGAPLSGGSEFTKPDFEAKNALGEKAIAEDSHVALAHPTRHGGTKLHRRAYNYSNGTDRVGHIDAGLLFLSFQKDLEKQFVPIQRALANNDRMNEYIKVVGSAAYACPPGLAPGQYWGHQLFN
jgi:deferrochelatase/peroxidase EfeB